MDSKTPKNAPKILNCSKKLKLSKNSRKCKIKTSYFDSKIHETHNVINEKNCVARFGK